MVEATANAEKFMNVVRRHTTIEELTHTPVSYTHLTEHREATAQQLVRPHTCDVPCAAQKQSQPCSSGQACRIR